MVHVNKQEIFSGRPGRAMLYMVNLQKIRQPFDHYALESLIERSWP